jgi:hypothetical protein
MRFTWFNGMPWPDITLHTWDAADAVARTLAVLA